MCVRSHFGSSKDSIEGAGGPLLTTLHRPAPQYLDSLSGFGDERTSTVFGEYSHYSPFPVVRE